MEINQREREFRRPSEGSIRVNRPVQSEARGEMLPEDSEPMEIPRVERKSLSRGPWILVGTLIIVLAILGYVFRDKLFGSMGGVSGNANYQAIFLTNGQVYFGKMTDQGGRYVKLDNIYYLQVTPVLQTKTEGQPGDATNAQQQQQLSLVKLGNELHGPVDEMQINRDQILFIEDLKEDGRVVQAIKDYETAQKK